MEGKGGISSSQDSFHPSSTEMASPPGSSAAPPPASEVLMKLEAIVLPGHVQFLAMTSDPALNNSHRLLDKNKEKYKNERPVYLICVPSLTLTNIFPSAYTLMRLGLYSF